MLTTVQLSLRKSLQNLLIKGVKGWRVCATRLA